MIQWPWPSFARALGIMLPGDLIVIAGRTGVGKTTFGMNLAWQLAVQDSGRVGYYALECGQDIPLWFQLMEMGVSRFAQRDPSQAGAVTQAELTIPQPEKLEIVDIPFPTADELVKGIEEEAFDVVIVDHLAAVDTSASRHAERQVFGRTVRRLKDVADTRGIPIIVLHQMGRGERQRAEFYRAPKIDDLYGSSIIEHTASLILGLYRSLSDEGRELLVQYNKGAPVPMWKYEVGMGVHVLKARSGARRWDLHLIPEQNEHGWKTDRLRDEDPEYDSVNPIDLLRARLP